MSESTLAMICFGLALIMAVSSFYVARKEKQAVTREARARWTSIGGWIIGVCIALIVASFVGWLV